VQNEAALSGRLTQTLGRIPLSSVRSDEQMAAEIDRFFDRDPDLDIVEIVPAGQFLEFHGTSVPNAEQNILEIEADLDWDRPVYMTYLGSYRARDMARVDEHGGRTSLVDLSEAFAAKRPQGAVPNPELHIYRVTNAKVRRYGLAND
jgi:hypothetical protein